MNAWEKLSDARPETDLPIHSSKLKKEKGGREGRAGRGKRSVEGCTLKLVITKSKCNERRGRVNTLSI